MLLRANSEVVSSAYLYQHFVSGFGMRVLLSNASQVGVPAIARPSTSLKAVPIVIPPKELIDRYDEMTKPMSNQVAQNTDRSRTLAEVRDTLLPRLLSGKTRVDATNEGRDEVTTP
jgi:type I restriction enzyme S subunit